MRRIGKYNQKMTWVIGRAGPFGYAVGLSDIRVTLHDGTKADCLQKIYRVGSNMALSFAGSVKIGFRIVEELSAGLHVTESKHSLDPLIIAKYLHIGTQDVFNSFPEEIRAGGCHLMLLSVHPLEKDGAAPWARCYVHRFYAPNFQPIEARSAEIVSIGSSKTVKPYADALIGFQKDFRLLNFETMTQHGSSLGLMASITSVINKIRVEGISNHLHTCLVDRDGVKVGKNDMMPQDHPEDNFIMPPVAQSWEELLKILDSRDIAKSVIEQARC